MSVISPVRRPPKPKAPPLDVLRLRTSLLDRATELLSAPPAKLVRRPEPRGSRVARFVLPLELCQPTNRTGRLAAAQPWRRAKDKEAVWLAMRAQCLPWDRPLPGRPLVFCVRFTPVATDPYADWAKAAVDVLCARSPDHPRRLGIIVDDRPAKADVVQWCEPPGKGGQRFCLIEVWTGGESG